MEIVLGDVYSVGPHIFACGDLEKGHHSRVLAHGPTPDMVFVDPPWNPGLATNFRRQAGYEERPDFPQLLGLVVQAVNAVDGPAYIEMGAQHQADILALMVGYPHVDAWEVPYTSHHSYVTRFGHTPAPTVLTGLKGLQVPSRAILADSRQGGVVVDFCLGLGATLQACMNLGRVCVGMELNPTRLARSIERAVKKTKCTPHHVGRL